MSQILSRFAHVFARFLKVFRIAAVATLIVLSSSSFSVADNPFEFRSRSADSNSERIVEFDAPAVAVAHVAVVPTVSDNPGKTTVLRPVFSTQDETVIEIVIPVTTRLLDSKKYRMSQFRFEVFWNRNVYPLVDYGPRTITGSNIEGLVSVEKREERNASIGLNLSGRFNELFNTSANGNLSSKNGKLLRYQEVPEHEVFVASGTIQRGTGAFFRFHPNRVATLEGGRELMVAYRVPRNWRGGLVQIDCHGKGKRKYFAGITEAVESHQSFVMPVFREGDQEARDIAFAYVRAEQKLRRELSGVRIGSKQLDISGLVEGHSTRVVESIHSSVSNPKRNTIESYLKAKKKLTHLSLD